MDCEVSSHNISPFLFKNNKVEESCVIYPWISSMDLVISSMSTIHSFQLKFSSSSYLRSPLNHACLADNEPDFSRTTC